jgi:hypothetical protein
VKSCTDCGAAAADTAIKCPNCGSLLVAPPTPLASTAVPTDWSAAAGAPGPSPFLPPVSVAAPPLVIGATSSSTSRSSLKVWGKRAVFVVVALFVYGVITNSHSDNNNVYSHAGQEAFVAGCTRSGSTESSCRCEFGWIKQNVAVDDYKAFGHLITSPGYTAAQTPEWMFQAVRTCVPALGGGANP